MKIAKTKYLKIYVMSSEVGKTIKSQKRALLAVEWLLRCNSGALCGRVTSVPGKCLCVGTFHAGFPHLHIILSANFMKKREDIDRQTQDIPKTYAHLQYFLPPATYQGPEIRIKGRFNGLS